MNISSAKARLLKERPRGLRKWRTSPWPFRMLLCAGLAGLTPSLVAQPAPSTLRMIIFRGVQAAPSAESTLLRVRASAGFTHTEYRPSPNLLLVDLHNVVLDENRQPVVLNQGPVSSYRIFDFSGANHEHVLRLEIALRGPARPEVSMQGGDLLVRVVAGTAGPTAAPVIRQVNTPLVARLDPPRVEPQRSPLPPALPQAHFLSRPAARPQARAAVAPSRIGRLRVERNDRETAIFVGAEPSLGPVHAYVLHQPERLVMDFAATRDDLDRQRWNVNSPTVLDVRVAQFTARTARVVVDLRKPVTAKIEQSSNGVWAEFPVNALGAEGAPRVRVAASVWSAREQAAQPLLAEVRMPERPSTAVRAGNSLVNETLPPTQLSPRRAKAVAQPLRPAARTTVLPTAHKIQASVARVNAVARPAVMAHAAVRPVAQPVHIPVAQPVVARVLPPANRSQHPPVRAVVAVRPVAQAQVRTPVVRSMPVRKQPAEPVRETMLSSENKMQASVAAANAVARQVAMAHAAGRPVAQPVHLPVSQPVVAGITTSRRANPPVFNLSGNAPSTRNLTRGFGADSHEPQIESGSAVTPRGVPPPSLSQPVQGLAPGTGAPVEYTGERITLNLKNADINDFFRLINQISGLNIVVDPNVKGTVTMMLQDVPWDQALDLVLRNNDLGRELEGNVVRIATLSTLQREAKQQAALAAARESAVPLTTVIRTLSYAQATALVPTLKKFVGARGDVTPDKRTNSLIIQTTPATVPLVDSLIAKLDEKTPQVEVEARVVAASRNFTRELGVQLGIGAGNSSSAVSGLPPQGTSTNASNTALAGITNPAYPLAAGGGLPYNVNLGASSPTSGISFINASNTYRIDAVLSAAEARGLGRVLSRPKIITQNNTKASVEQGVQIPIQTTINNTISIQFFPVVLQLTVTPQITAENTVFLQVDVKNQQIDTGIPAIQGVPAIDTQEATTNVLVSNGGTVVIGGVMVNNTANSVQQVPLLGSLPVVGYLFKHTTVTDNSNELLFFITPRII